MNGAVQVYCRAAHLLVQRQAKASMYGEHAGVMVCVLQS
jgi:hypothetical protein